MATQVERALYETAHDFPGGIEALASRLGRAPGTIYNKADPGCETHQFSVREAVAMMLAAGDYRCLQAMGRAVGYACIPHGDFRNCSDMELLEVYTELHRELGETAAVLADGVRGRKFSHAQLEVIEREIHEDIEAALALLSRIRGLVDE